MKRNTRYQAVGYKKLALVIIFLTFLSEKRIPAQINSGQISLPGRSMSSVQTIRVDSLTGTPASLSNINHPVDADSPENMAREYLSNYADQFGMTNDLSDLHIRSVKETRAGYRIHFDQFVDDIQVYNASVVVSINRNNQIVFIMNHYKPIKNVSGSLAATKTPVNSISTINGDHEDSIKDSKTIVYFGEHGAKYAKLLNIVSKDGVKTREIVVDPVNAEILEDTDMILYNKKTHDHKSKQLKVTGMVYDPDPVTLMQAEYGIYGLLDDFDKSTNLLDSLLVSVHLPDIDYNSETQTYNLAGHYAAIVDQQAPFSGLHSQKSPEFNFTRSDSSFEAVNVYYHIDKSMRYINEELGYTVMPYQYPGGVRFDPHALENKVNARYQDGYLYFGSPNGYVDLGEDCAVILHELGHGIHDWITDGNLSNREGLSEGSGDYWAQSYIRSLNLRNQADPGYNWFVCWGGQPRWQNPYLRKTESEFLYNVELSGINEIDGQIWSSALMLIYDIIGKENTDKLFLEALSMTSRFSIQRDAAYAFLQADRDLFNGAHLDIILNVFTKKGYLLPENVFAVTQNSGHAPLRIQFSDLLLLPDQDQVIYEWDFNGDYVIDSYDPDPDWTYNNPGIYSPCLTISYKSFRATFENHNHIHVFDQETALQFDNSKNLAIIMPSHSLKLSRSFTIETWIRPVDLDKPKFLHSRIFSRFSLFLEILGSTESNYNPNSFLLTIKTENGNFCEFNTNENVNRDNQWQHIAITFDSLNADVQLYIDGIKQELITNLPFDGKLDFTENRPFVIGNSQNGFQPFCGQIDEFRVWNTSRQQYEIQKAMYESILSGYAELIGYYPMDEAFGDTLFDNSGNENHALLTGTKWVEGFSSGILSVSQLPQLSQIPELITLVENFPNPFNNTSKIRFTLRVATYINLSIYNILGQEVRTLIDEFMPAGNHTIAWGGDDNSGLNVSSGIYIYQIRTNEKVVSGKMTQIK